MTEQDFRDPQLVRGLVDVIARDAAGRHIRLMEVCGSHTMAIARFGLRSVMPEGLELLSGPGCPVCVTANYDIDHAIALARVPGLTITTFGDMMRVPGSTSSLAAEKARGADVRIVYSPLDALALAREDPNREVVFLGVGFETTAPAVAATLLEASGGASAVPNFSVLCLHKLTPPALDAIASDEACAVDGFILPGHVSTITGLAPYAFLAEKYGLPGVVTGFEPVDILEGIALLVRQVQSEKPARIENAYRRNVRDDGNPAARGIMDDVFVTCDATWRGLGSIPSSGLAIRPELAALDAARRFDVEVEPTVEHRACRCGDVLRGRIAPDECPLFGKLCTPENPVGPCMVSSEGSCAAFFRYHERSTRS